MRTMTTMFDVISSLMKDSAVHFSLFLAPADADLRKGRGSARIKKIAKLIFCRRKASNSLPEIIAMLCIEF